VHHSTDAWPEAVAEEFLRSVGADNSPDALTLAHEAGLNPTAGAVERAEIGSDGTLVYRGDALAVDQQRWVSMELAGWLLRQQRLDDSQEPRSYTAAALLLPREGFMRYAELTGWNLRELQVLYPNASMGTMALRIAMLHEAVVTWFDHGETRWRAVAPAYRSELYEPTRFEQHLAAIALETDTILSPARRVWAFPLNRQVGAALVVCDAKELFSRRDSGR
jgi:hypothetical protein